MGGSREPKFGDGNKRLQSAMDLIESGMSIPEVHELTGYAVSTLYKIKSGNFGNCKPKGGIFDETVFHKEWTETVNKFRKAAGLPLFKVGGENN